MLPPPDDPTLVFLRLPQHQTLVRTNHSLFFPDRPLSVPLPFLLISVRQTPQSGPKACPLSLPWGNPPKAINPRTFYSISAVLVVSPMHIGYVYELLPLISQISWRWEYLYPPQNPCDTQHMEATQFILVEMRENIFLVQKGLKSVSNRSVSVLAFLTMKCSYKYGSSHC